MRLMIMSGNNNGQEQIRAGLALIEWSGLAKLGQDNRLIASRVDHEFENLATGRHPQFGRVLSWAVFAIGCEYVLKGACLARNLISAGPKDVLRPPRWDEDLDSWSAAVLKRDSSVLVKATNTGTLAGLPLVKLLGRGPEARQHRAAVELLRDSMRNRDAHQYVPNVRAAHFQAVPRLFVPALNAVLDATMTAKS
jgi:hypothetical protein